MTGRVIKFYNSFFFVQVENDLIPCKLRGILQRDKKIEKLRDIGGKIQ